MHEIQVPIGLSGVVSKLIGANYCMDGSAQKLHVVSATHLLHTVTGATRLKGQSREAAEALASVEDGETHVMVMGYQTWGVECMYIAVYHVALVEEMYRVMPSDWKPWPMNVLV